MGVPFLGDAEKFLGVDVTYDVVNILMQILTAINNQKLQVNLDGEEIKNNVVRRINNHTRQTGRLEIVM